MLSESQKLIFLQIKNQNEFLRIKNEFPRDNKMLSEQWRIYIQEFPVHAPPPNRTKFFCFYICFHQKVPVSEVGTPSNEGWRPPQREILDPPLVNVHFFGEEFLTKRGNKIVFRFVS